MDQKSTINTCKMLLSFRSTSLGTLYFQIISVRSSRDNKLHWRLACHLWESYIVTYVICYSNHIYHPTQASNSRTVNSQNLLNKIFGQAEHLWLTKHKYIMKSVLDVYFYHKKKIKSGWDIRLFFLVLNKLSFVFWSK